jgi:hypothetical protein
VNRDSYETEVRVKYIKKVRTLTILVNHFKRKSMSSYTARKKSHIFRTKTQPPLYINGILSLQWGTSVLWILVLICDTIYRTWRNLNYLIVFKANNGETRKKKQQLFFRGNCHSGLVQQPIVSLRAFSIPFLCVCGCHHRRRPCASEWSM